MENKLNVAINPRICEVFWIYIYNAIKDVKLLLNIISLEIMQFAALRNITANCSLLGSLESKTVIWLAASWEPVSLSPLFKKNASCTLSQSLYLRLGWILYLTLESS